jgi:O-antigen/teichoic acid export membrane protein
MNTKLSTKQWVFVKNLFLTTILGGIIGILNYLFNIFVARYTDQNIFSTFSAALGIIYLVQIPAVAIQSVITKGVAKNKGARLDHYKWYSFGVFSLLGIVFSVLFFLARGTIADIANIPTDIVLFLAITLFFAFVSPVGKGLLLGKEKIGTVNLILLFETILKFVMGWIAIQMGGSVPLLILANGAPAILTTIFILPLVRFKTEKEKKVKINFKELVLITLSFLFLSGPFILSLPLVNPIFRAEFSAISILGKLVYFASIMTASVLFARVANEKVEKDQKKSLMLSLILSVSIGLFISLTFFLFKDLIITFTVGEQYLTVSNYIASYGLCMTAFAFVYMVANFFISRENYNFIYILLLATVLQILSFVFRNDTLDMVMLNQYVVYGFMAFSTAIYLIFKLRSIDNGRGKSKKEG